MKPILILFFLSMAFCNINAQDNSFQEPDYESIKSEVEDSSSEFYYPGLLARYTSFDTTLTQVDYRHLYYGYLYHEDYEPYWRSKQGDELKKYYQSPQINEEDYDKVIELATQSIGDNPFDLRPMNFLGYIYHLKGDEVMAKKVMQRLHGVIGAIFSTGDGRECGTAFHVISPSHEYLILNILRFQMKTQALTGDCDYLELAENDRNIDGIYFNIKKLFEINKDRMSR